jgi:hypothetical protein
MFCLLASILFVLRICFGESSDSSTWAYLNWGENVHGVRMSAVIATNTLTADSTLWIHVRVENQSTNVVRVNVSNPRVDFKIVLTCSSGKKYVYHEDHPISLDLNSMVKLNPGQHQDASIPLQIDKNVDLGECSIIVNRSVVIRGEGKFEVVSNLLKAQIAR